MPKGSPAQIARIIEQRAAALQPRLVKAETASAQEALAEGRARSTTQHYSLAQLRRMGHPYAKRRPRPPMYVGIINRQSGKFVAGWESDTFESFGSIVSRVRNRSEHARFMLGKGFMVERPIWKIVKMAANRHRRERLRKAVKGALKTR